MSKNIFVEWNMGEEKLLFGLVDVVRYLKREIWGSKAILMDRDPYKTLLKLVSPICF